MTRPVRRIARLLARNFWRGINAAAASLLIPALVVVSIPLSPVTAQAEETVVVNRTVPQVDPPPLYPVFSDKPTDDEIFRARVFGEPLQPTGATTPEENEALADAVSTWLQQGNPENTSVLEAFLSNYPNSAWKPSLLTQLGATHRRLGKYTRAMVELEEAWALTKAGAGRAAVIADVAAGHLIELNMKFDPGAGVQRILDQQAGREPGGQLAERVLWAKESIRVMNFEHENAVPSGPLAVDRVMQSLDPGYRRHPNVAAMKATHEGATIKEIRDLANSIGLQMQIAKWTPEGAIPIPSIGHLKLGHFTAIVGERGGRYWLDDPILGYGMSDTTRVTRATLEEELSGYFLIPAGALPPGWLPVNERDVADLRGRCMTALQFWGDFGDSPPCQDCPPGGMAAYVFDSFLASLQIRDTPVGYDTPRGPAVKFVPTYNQRDTVQPATPYYSNLGPLWTDGWVAWVEDTPSDLSADALIVLRGGGARKAGRYNVTTTSYESEPENSAVLVRVTSSPIRYERRHSDGSIEVYTQPDGAQTYPRRVFLTQVVDPQGQSITMTHDSSFRIVSVTDAIGQVTTLTYEHSDPLKITKVTDPFGRSALFEYNSLGQLVKITDVIGMASKFTYASSNFLSALTTPYGTTTFNTGGTGGSKWIQATDPLGGTERVEWIPSYGSATESASVVPYGFTTENAALEHMNSYYWSKLAWARYPGDYSKSVITHWRYGRNQLEIRHVKASEKKPLENRVWFGQTGENQFNGIGPIAKPSRIARVLDDGSSQIYRYEYNAKGNVTRFADPVGRETVYTYASNGIDRLTAKQKNGSNYDLLQTVTYNSLHQPLTITDTAGQVTTFTYNANGTPATVVTPPRGALTDAERTTSFSYYADNAPSGAGRVQTVTKPPVGGSSASVGLTYDSYGRPDVVTANPDDYSLNLDHDALDRVIKTTYPDGTFEETVYSKLDVQKTRDRLGRWSHSFHDATGRAISTADPVGNTTTLIWCPCGALEKFIDANGNATTWERDLQGRVTREARANGSDRLFVYETTTSRLKEYKDSFATRQVKTYSYTLDGSLSGVTYTNELSTSPDVTFTYETAYPRLASRVDGPGTTTFAYHAIGSPPSLGAGKLLSIDGPLANDTITFSYDELGRGWKREINGTANSLTFGFDALGRVTSEASALGTFTRSYVSQTKRASSISYPNGQTIEYDYFANVGDRRLKQIHNKLSGGSTLSKFDYTRDAVGNITSWAQQYDSGSARTLSFGYDAADQLISAARSASDPTLVDRFAYTYDRAGNRTTEQLDDSPTKAVFDNMNRLMGTEPGGTLRFSGSLNEAGGVTVSGKPAQVNASNQFEGSAVVGSGTTNVTMVATDPANNTRTNTYQVSVSGSAKSFTYDSNGNLVNDGTRAYAWDAENRVVLIRTGADCVSSGTSCTEFSYDGLGRRIRIVEKVNGSTTSDKRYVWLGLRLSEERNTSDNTVTKRFFDSGLVDGATAFFYTKDHLGSIVEMTNSSGTIQARYDYDPYGRRTKLAGTGEAPFGYTGHHHHQSTGLALAPYRAYDANLGRWLSEDPIGLAGGLNLFGYVGNRPTTLRDPFGLAAAGGNVISPCEPEGCIRYTITACADCTCYTYSWPSSQCPPRDPNDVHTWTFELWVEADENCVPWDPFPEDEEPGVGPPFVPPGPPGNPGDPPDPTITISPNPDDHPGNGPQNGGPSVDTSHGDPRITEPQRTDKTPEIDLIERPYLNEDGTMVRGPDGEPITRQVPRD